MDHHAEIAEMRGEYHAKWIGQKVWAISENENGTFTVHQQNPNGVAPPSDYPTLRKAAARLLQLLGTGAIAPQTWPENVCIGNITTTPEDE